jgi:cyclopropane-fatty-acyl-phospholipid synthase
LPEITAAVEKSGLFITDVEPLHLHYAETLRQWRARFQAHRAEIAALYDERFCRMWEFYLCYCELGFRYGDLMVFQVQLAKRLDTLPITRDYMMPRASARVADSEETDSEVRKSAARAGQTIRQGEAR